MARKRYTQRQVDLVAMQFVYDWMKVPACDSHGDPVAACDRQMFTTAVAGLIGDFLNDDVYVPDAEEVRRMKREGAVMPGGFLRRWDLQ